MKRLHKSPIYDIKIEPSEGQSGLLCSNKLSYDCPSLGPNNFLFSEETIESLSELGAELKKIHDRLISEGYIFKDGKIFKPDELTNKI